MALRPVTRHSVSDAVYDQLAVEIIGGDLAPGDPLPSERSLTEVLGVNRQAVREALKRLDQAGLVEIAHGETTRVRDFRRDAGLDLLASLLVHPDGTVDVAVARSVMELRACIGPDAARLCALRAVPDLLHQLGQVLDAMAAVPDDLDARGALDWRFWELVVDGSDNIAYRLAFNSLRDASFPEGIRAIHAVELSDLADHRTLVRAIEQGDDAAAERTARRIVVKGAATVAEALTRSRP
jgi:GntR family transcriptional repressor for pyruvate dehydrogenase complex